MPVVVVLPAAPETARQRLRRAICASSSERCSSSSALARSGFSAGTALEYTTSAPAGTFAAA